MKIFSSPVLTALEKALDAAALRESTIANNVANVNTPGFKRSYVNFEEALQKSLNPKSNFTLAADEQGHLQAAENLETLQPEVATDYSTSMRQDGNNVDIDSEMVQAAMNMINYNFAAAKASSKLSILSYVISGGNR
ncbi:flagellar basal body rod protein FlgB [Bacillota bacterium LX-D]|nr:flagellar basal body rod protein FlgB [Bacillota bacterium LX-D]